MQESEHFGISQAAFARAERFRRLPKDAAGFVSEMTSSFVEGDLADAYLQDRSQRKQTAEILQAEGVKGCELGQIMCDLRTLAEFSVGRRAADEFFDRMKKRPDVAKLMRKLSKS